MSFIGIDIGGTKMLVSGEVENRIISKRYPTGKEISFSSILDNYNSFLIEYNIEPKALGIAIPGLIDGNKVTACDVVPSLEGIGPKDFSSSYPVEFINDVNGAMVEESSNHSNKSNLIVIMIGTGIGMSIKIDGRETIGATGFTGELGYTTVNTKEGPTYLDNVSAGVGILKKFGGTAEELNEALDREDQHALKVIEEAGNYMGMALASTISLLNPEVIIIGGGTSHYRGYFETIVKKTQEYTLPVLYNPVEIKRTTNPGMTVVNGCLKISKRLSLI